MILSRIEVTKDNIPDATTILVFRHFIERHQLAEKIFKTVGQCMREKGLVLREGTVVDATIIHTPTSAKNEKRDQDPQMHQTRKGSQWFFGMKVQIGVDAAELLHGEGKVLYGDAGYQGLEKQEEMAG